MTFLIRGVNAESAKAELRSLLSVKTNSIIKVPVDCRPVLIGKAGVTLKKIMADSHTFIKFKQNESIDQTVCNDVEILIKGDAEGIKIAIGCINEIVASRIDKHRQCFTVERNIHPFLGPLITKLSLANSVKIHIAPMDAIAVPEKNLEEIVIIGHKDNTIMVQNALIEHAKELVICINFNFRKRLYNL
jgi:hypothetical protein